MPKCQVGPDVTDMRAGITDMYARAREHVIFVTVIQTGLLHSPKRCEFCHDERRNEHKDAYTPTRLSARYTRVPNFATKNATMVTAPGPGGRIITTPETSCVTEHNFAHKKTKTATKKYLPDLRSVGYTSKH